MEKVAQRTYGIPSIDMSGLDAFIESRRPQTKQASAEYVPDLTGIEKVSMGTPEAAYLQKFASAEDAGTMSLPNGHFWRVAEIDGERYIVFDDERTGDNLAVSDLVGA